MKIHKRWLLAEDLVKLRGQPFVVKVQTFWRKGWDRIPEIMASTGLGVVGTLMLLYSAYSGIGRRERKYLSDITIYRPDDPRVKEIEYTSRYD